MAKLPSISNLTLEQLQKLKTDLAKEEGKKKRTQKSKLVTQLAGEIKQAGFSVEEIARAMLARTSRGTGAKRARRKAASKSQVYADPGNSKNTWTFKGRAPRWVEEQMKTAGLDVKNRDHKEKFKAGLKKV